ncbi:sensor histidine kinase [Deminuibacter soli]|uniref:histidine kinase n=1 Tax=Deminuibacter soli TaxID=2291815 RepID=A0A3E1NIG9_9BACT|nr:HAMP domain-containing sensor histidine kinase [Deminuibacter soli]RFM27746.1 sensor histidine kinase [Deminuibacter soli]
MKLFSRYNRINLLATVVIFLLSSGAFYALLRYVLIDQVDDDLKIEQHEIITYVNKYNRLPEVVPVKDQVIQFTPGKTIFHKRQLFNAKLHDPITQEEKPFRQLRFNIAAGGQWYTAGVGKSLDDTDALTAAIITITLGTLLLILLVSSIINRLVLKKLWKPFYQSMQVIQGFSLAGTQPLQFTASGTDEFDFMNHVLQQTTQKAGQDYLVLKNFTENAAHELQTPLAIIQSKLDVLIQDEQLTPHQGQAVQSAYEAIQRLTHLNQCLLLLAKIENKQFSDTEQLNLEQAVSQKLQHLEELIHAQQLTTKVQLQPATITMNPALLDILLNNLLSNAIRHTHTGVIAITLEPSRLQIGNTGNAPLNSAHLFTRFYKADAGNAAHNGLGLAIAHEICAVSGYQLQYAFNHGLHVFTLTFTEQMQQSV